MKEFLCSKSGNIALGVVLAIVVFVILNILFGLGGAIGGAIAGGVGFGGAAIIKNALKPAEKTNGNDTN
jgi:hypothetical protein